MEMKTSEKSLEDLGKEIKQVLDQADKVQIRADDLKITAGRMLLEAKARIKGDGQSWLAFLKQHELNKRTTQKVMQIAKGDKTEEQMKVENSRHQEKHRKESALRKAYSHTPSIVNKSSQPQAAIASKIDDQNIKSENDKPVPIDTWDTDQRTIVLKQTNERQKQEIQQANRRNDELKDQIDDLNEQLKEYKQIKAWAEDNDNWDWVREQSDGYKKKSRY
jgi:hypothetical protein